MFSAERDGFKSIKLDENVISELVEKIKELKIDVLILDPLADFHKAGESANEDMDQIVKRLNAIADECKIPSVSFIIPVSPKVSAMDR